MSDQPKKSAVAEQEEQMLQIWSDEGTFQASLSARKGADVFSFYDGPPFANGRPHWGGMMTSVLKDAVCRYKTMQGYYVPRRFGWDCHGLPPELEVEKQLGVHGKVAIRAYGADKFVNACRASVLRYTDIWHQYVSRIGRWVDFDDDYRTMDTSYTESVWWAFKSLYDKGLIYQDLRVLPYSYGAETALSNFETRLDDSYREREDLTVTFKTKLSDGRIALVWTTVPWTIPANLLLAIGQDLDYVDYEHDGTTYVLAKDALPRYEKKLGGGKVLKTYKGSELLGVTYTPAFDYFIDTPKAFRVVNAAYVETESGTGVVSVAPGHGEDDFWVAKQEGVGPVSPVDDQGRFTEQVKDYMGRLVFDANNELVADMEDSGKIIKTELYKHMYPHCWRTDVPIIYRAMPGWFVDVSKVKDKMLEQNKQIDWHPSHVKDGAFGKWLENAREWNISRKRYWGAPIPIWKTDDGELIVVGSIEELKAKAKGSPNVEDLHRPWIDDVVLVTEDGREAHRVEDVFDCWFESGSMPFASVHYPFENKELFESRHPGDFITEYIGQTRGWFYTLHVMSVALFEKPAFSSSVAHGIILGTDGRKMSKRLGNYPELESVFNNQGSDSVRLYLLGSSLFSGETAAFDTQALQEAQRNLVQRLTNSFSFFDMYAKVDGWQPPKTLEPPASNHLLDEWMLTRLDAAITEVTKAADAYNTPTVVRNLFELVDDMSNWFIRRSRRRFWKTEDDNDKQAAYQTLWYVLLRTSQLMAPWAPFASDRVWRELTKNTDLPKSVHLSDWPKPNNTSRIILATMQQVREAITEGLAQRAEAKIKVRQPLAQVSFNLEIDNPERYSEMAAEELNVKEVVWVKSGDKVKLDTQLTPELEQEGLMREIVRHVQNARKAAGLNVDDRIELGLGSSDSLVTEAVKRFKAEIDAEALATGDLAEEAADAFEQTAKLGEYQLTIRLKKAQKA